MWTVYLFYTPSKLYVVWRLYERSKISCMYCVEMVYTLQATLYAVYRMYTTFNIHYVYCACVEYTLENCTLYVDCINFPWLYLPSKLHCTSCVYGLYTTFKIHYMYTLYVLYTPSEIVRCMQIVRSLYDKLCVLCTDGIYPPSYAVRRIRIVHNLRDTLYIRCICCTHPRKYTLCVDCTISLW